MRVHFASFSKLNGSFANHARRHVGHVIPAPPTPPSRVSTVDSEDENHQLFSRRTNPLQNASLFSIVLAHWIQPMICLELQDMWPTGKNDSCDPKPRIWNISPVAMAYAKTFRKELIVVLFGPVVYALALGMQSYRINTIMHCDKIAVMDAGRVVEFDSPFAALTRRS